MKETSDAKINYVLKWARNWHFAFIEQPYKYRNKLDPVA